MYLSVPQTLILILAVAVGAQLTRWLPFLLLPEGKEVPKTVEYLGKLLPAAAMGLLVVYCLRNVSLFASSHGIPETAAILTVGLLHWWKGNVLLSIAGGTTLYMVLIQTVFA
ncbi:branched-chain amino acid transporter permease [Oscillibacter sp.]|uniref:branched-chain amino acid transporter permease n=1 Tax=Oscillibacter sp. TaxID=1945593 RepID=UPI00289C447D|nr:branched-chain amino acid transporter permease [Oscillibacter sp.]